MEWEDKRDKECFKGRLLEREKERKRRVIENWLTNLGFGCVNYPFYSKTKDEEKVKEFVYFSVSF